MGEKDNPAGLHYRAIIHNTSDSVSIQLRLPEWAGNIDAYCKHMWRCNSPLRERGFSATASGGAHP